MVDRYTKFMLTVIAASLVVIILRDIPVIQTAFAAGDTKAPVSVVIENKYPLDIRIKDIDWSQKPLPVKVEK